MRGVSMVLVAVVVGCAKKEEAARQPTPAELDPASADRSFRWLVAEHTKYLQNPGLSGNALDAESRKKAWEKVLADAGGGKIVVKWGVRVGAITKDARVTIHPEERPGHTGSDANGPFRHVYKLVVVRNASPDSFPIEGDAAWVAAAKSGDPVVVEGPVAVISLGSEPNTKRTAPGVYDTTVHHTFYVRLSASASVTRPAGTAGPR